MIFIPHPCKYLQYIQLTRDSISSALSILTTSLTYSIPSIWYSKSTTTTRYELHLIEFSALHGISSLDFITKSSHWRLLSILLIIKLANWLHALKWYVMVIQSRTSNFSLSTVDSFAPQTNKEVNSFLVRIFKIFQFLNSYHESDTVNQITPANYPSMRTSNNPLLNRFPLLEILLRPALRVLVAAPSWILPIMYIISELIRFNDHVTR